MSDREPVAGLETQFSSDGATATPWAEARERLENAEVYWMSTVRPHVAPLAAVWLDDALYFASGPDERKAKNLAHNPHCVITTGRNVLEGLDPVVEGEPWWTTRPDSGAWPIGTLRSTNRPSASPCAKARFTAKAPLVCQLSPVKAFGFGKGESFNQTRWSFRRALARPVRSSVNGQEEIS